MITSINSINSINNRQNISFEGKNAKRISKAIKELPYKLGIKKKKTFWEKVKDFFTSNKSKAAKKSSKNQVSDEPKKDNIFQVVGKDFSKRIKELDDILF